MDGKQRDQSRLGKLKTNQQSSPKGSRRAIRNVSNWGAFKRSGVKFKHVSLVS